MIRELPSLKWMSRPSSSSSATIISIAAQEPPARTTHYRNTLWIIRACVLCEKKKFAMSDWVVCFVYAGIPIKFGKFITENKERIKEKKEFSQEKCLKVSSYRKQNCLQNWIAFEGISSASDRPPPQQSSVVTCRRWCYLMLNTSECWQPWSASVL